MSDIVFAYKPEKGRLSGGWFEKQTEYFFSLLQSSLTTEITEISDKLDTVLAKVEDLSARVTAVEATVAEHETRISDLETDNASNKNRITALETTVAEHTEAIADLQSRMTSAETTISEHTEELAEHAEAITDQQGRMTSAETTISEHTEAITDLQSRMEAAEINISVLQNDSSDMSTTIGDLVTKVNSAVTSVEHMQASVSSMEANVANMSTTVNETYNLVQTGRYASAYIEGDAQDACWFKVAETETLAASLAEGTDGNTTAEHLSTTLELSLLAQPVGDETASAFTWDIEATIASDWATVQSCTPKGYALEDVPDGMEDRFVVSSYSYTDEDSGSTYTRLTLWVQIPTGASGWKFTINGEASKSLLTGTNWNLYQLEGADGEAEIPAEHTVYATTFVEVAPTGLIALAEGDAPAGYELCDGTDSTPDLSAYATGDLVYVQRT